MKLRKGVRLAFRLARKRLAKNLDWVEARSVSPGLSKEEFRILFINTYLLGAKELLDQLKSEGLLKGSLTGYPKSVGNLKISKAGELPRNLRLTISRR